MRSGCDRCQQGSGCPERAAWRVSLSWLLLKEFLLERTLVPHGPGSPQPWSGFPGPRRMLKEFILNRNLPEIVTNEQCGENAYLST